jgi:hypothetical protein
MAHRRTFLALGAAAVLGGAVVPALASGSSAGVAVPAPGVVCRSGVTVAHHAGGVLLSPQPSVLPLACGGTTGFAGAESHIVGLKSGAVVYTPAVVPSGSFGTNVVPVSAYSGVQTNASPAGLAITRDRGAHWSLVKPSGVTWNPTDHGDFVDPSTGRLFFEDYGPIPLAPRLAAFQEGPAHINWSSDEGRSWHHTAIPSVFLPENPRFVSGVAPAGQARPVGYPRVTYFCANTNVGFTSPAIAGRVCFRSLDGGTSWKPGAVLFTGVAPQHRECGQSGESYSAIDGNYPQATRNGYLYVMVSCGGSTYLARSVDEAASFPIEHVGGAPLTLPVPAGGGIGGGADFRIGPDDTMYLAYQVSSALLIRTSRDLGRTWSAPLNVVAPGVVAVHQWAFASGGAGDVAVSYLGQRAGQKTWDAYVTQTHDALDASPVFYSARVNSPTRPLLYGDSIQGSGYFRVGGHYEKTPPVINNQGTGNDFIGATVDFGGNAWGSFTQDCGGGPAWPSCTAQHNQTRGYAGYLRWPS